MNTKNAVEKLYESTPVSMLATLSASAFFRSDHGDMTDIHSALAKRSAGAQLRFAVASHGHIESVLLWALDCHATNRQILTLTLFVTSYDEADLSNQQEISKLKGVLVLKDAMRRRLASLIAAMQRICESGGFEFEPRKSIAGIDAQAELLIGDAPPIPELVNEFVTQYGVTP